MTNGNHYSEINLIMSHVSFSISLKLVANILVVIDMPLFLQQAQRIFQTALTSLGISVLSKRLLSVILWQNPCANTAPRLCLVCYNCQVCQYYRQLLLAVCDVCELQSVTLKYVYHPMCAQLLCDCDSWSGYFFAVNVPLWMASHRENTSLADISLHPDQLVAGLYPRLFKTYPYTNLLHILFADNNLTSWWCVTNFHTICFQARVWES